MYVIADGPVSDYGLEYLTIVSLDNMPLNVGLLVSRLSRSTGSCAVTTGVASFGYTGANFRLTSLTVVDSKERLKEALIIRSLFTT